MVRGSVSYVRGGPDPGQGSDVAHCAQNSSQNARLTISLSNTRARQRATAEGERTRTKALFAPATGGGGVRAVEPTRLVVEVTSNFKAARYGPPMAAILALNREGEEGLKTKTFRGSTELVSLLLSSRPPKVALACKTAWCYTRSTTTRGRVLCVTKRRRVSHHVVRLEDGSAAPPHLWSPEPVSRSTQLNNAAMVPLSVRCYGITAQCASGKPQLEPSTPSPEPMGERSQHGPAKDSSAVSLGWPCSLPKRSTCQGKGAVCSRVFLQDANRNPMKGTSPHKLWQLNRARRKRFSDLNCPSRRPLTQCNSRLHVPQDGRLPKPPIPGAH
jgi:hypothetical protein